MLLFFDTPTIAPDFTFAAHAPLRVLPLTNEEIAASTSLPSNVLHISVEASMSQTKQNIPECDADHYIDVEAEPAVNYFHQFVGEFQNHCDFQAIFLRLTFLLNIELQSQNT